MIGVVEKTDSFGERTKFDIIGRDIDDIWLQFRELEQYAYACDWGARYDLIEYIEHGIRRCAYSGTILTK